MATIEGLRRSAFVKDHASCLYAKLCAAIGQDGIFNVPNMLVERVIGASLIYWANFDFEDTNNNCDMDFGRIIGKREEIQHIILAILGHEPSAHKMINNLDVAIHAQVVLEKTKTT